MGNETEAEGETNSDAYQTWVGHVSKKFNEQVAHNAVSLRVMVIANLKL